MEIKLEGRQVELGDELKERVRKRLEGLDDRFGPLTHARVTVSRNARKNEQRAQVVAVVNIAGSTITASKDSPTVVAAVNECMDTLTEMLKDHVDKTKKAHR